MNPCQRIRLLNRRFPFLLLLAVFTFLCWSGEPAQAGPPGNPDVACWESMKLGIPGARSSYLVAVSASASDDVWAVGGLSYKDTPTEVHPLIHHWDGHRWEPLSLTLRGSLQGVVALSSRDVWAVGTNGNPGYEAIKALILHWDGIQWSEVSAPLLTANHTLSGVEAVSPNDIWAIGIQANRQPLIMHWDGTAWSIVKSPQFAEGSYHLTGISAVTADDVWIVGDFSVAGANYRYRTLILHWDGANWAVIPSPSPSDANIFMYDVVGISANDALAVGSYYDANNQERRAFSIRWDGQTWTGSSPPKKIKHLHNVASVESGKSWGTGLVGNSFAGRAQLLKWNGVRWRNAHLDSVPPNSSLTGIAALSNMNLWAVGAFQTQKRAQKGLIVQRIPCE